MVVITILASITVVAYSGIKENASVAVVKTDLRTIAQQMEIFKARNFRYPVQDVGGDYLEHEQVLRSSNLFDVTRWSGDVATRAERGYIFCLTDPKSYTLVAFEPMYTFLRTDGPKYVGQPLYYVQTGGKLAETVIQWDPALESVGRNICKSATGVDPGDDSTTVRWTYSVPFTYAP